MERLEGIGSGGRIMGLDYGKRFVGVAVSDPLFVSAQGVETVERKRPDKHRQTLARLEQLCEQYDISAIVLGFPKNLDGSLNERCEFTIDFADMLFARLNRPIYLWDERLTTQSAMRTLTTLEKKEKKKFADEMSAMLILQGFMDAVSNGVKPRPYKE